MKNQIFYIAFGIAFLGCSKKPAYDASGTFETDELIVSAEQSGAILSLPFKEGDTLQAGQKVGAFDNQFNASKATTGSIRTSHHTKNH